MSVTSQLRSKQGPSKEVTRQQAKKGLAMPEKTFRNNQIKAGGQMPTLRKQKWLSAFAPVSNATKSPANSSPPQPL